MRDLWKYRWKAWGIFWLFYALMIIGFEVIPDPYSLIGIIPFSSMIIVFLIISSSHEGWIAKRRNI